MMNDTDSADNMDVDNLDEVEFEVEVDVPSKKVDNRVRGKGDKGRCTKSNSKRNYCKKRKSPWRLKKESEGVILSLENIFGKYRLIRSYSPLFQPLYNLNKYYV